MTSLLDPEVLRQYRAFEGACNQRTVSLFAVDVKITPTNETYVIELNGSDFGWQGFRQAEPHHPIEENLIAYLTSFGLPVTVLAARTTPNKMVETLVPLSDGRINVQRITFDALASEDFSTIGLEARLGMEHPYGIARHTLETRMPVFDRPVQNPRYERLVLDRSCLQVEFDPQRYLVVNDVTLNAIVKDKDRTKQFFLGYQITPDGVELCRDPNSTQYASFSHFLERCKTDKIILKPVDGSLGVGIRVVKKEDLYLPSGDPIRDIFALRDRQGLIIAAMDDRIIAEEFIESKPILSDITGRYHDGCMRYVVALETIPQPVGSSYVKVTHFGGYWRLCPEPIDSGSSNLERRMKANLSDGALAQTATVDEIRTVQQCLDKILPAVYRRMLATRFDGSAPSLFTDVERVVSETSFLSRQATSAAFRSRRGDNLDLYSLEEIAAMDATRLHRFPGSTRTIILDRKTRRQFNGSILLFDILHFEPEHLLNMRYQEAYATAVQINLPERATLSLQSLRQQLKAYADNAHIVKEKHTWELTQLPFGKLHEIAVATHRINPEEEYTSFQLLKQAFDYKAMITDYPLATADDLSPEKLKDLIKLQIYELAIQYGIETRVRLKGNGIDKEDLIRVLIPFIQKRPKLSVFVDAYRSGPHIVDCIESLLSQKVVDGFEICLVADGTDNYVRRVIGEFQRLHRDKTIRVRYTFTDKGHNYAYKTGLELCRGDYIITMRGSDQLYREENGIPSPRHLQILLDVAVHSDYGAVFPRRQFIDNQGQPAGRFATDTERSNGMLYPFMMFKKELYEELKRHDLSEFDPSNIYTPDPELGLKIGTMCQIMGIKMFHHEFVRYEQRLEEDETLTTCSARFRREISDATRNASKYRAALGLHT